MSDLPLYPDDPIQEKDMQSFTVLCTQKEANYKKYSDKIMQSCTEKSKTPIKIQKIVIDKIKEIIKANPKKHSALQKFFALKLLNKIVIKKNIELNIYVEQKILARLTILAEFNNDSSEKSAQALLTRGKNIFGPEEKDSQSSANFLIILLDCIEKWALTFQFEDGEANDSLSTSSKSKASSGDKFYKSYTKLLEKGVKFPSTFKQLSTSKQSSTNSQKNDSNLQKDQIKKKEQTRIIDPQSIEPQQFIEEQKNRQSAVSEQQYDDTKSVSNQSSFSNQSLTQEKKSQINKLKKKMQSVKESSKLIKKQVQDQLTNKIYTNEKLTELQLIQQNTIQFSKQCEDAISELMSDEIQPFISNSEQLIQKMFGYSETFAIALNDINSIIQNQKSKLKKNSEIVKQTKNNDEEEDEELKKAIEESKRESLKFQEKQVENKSNQNFRKNEFYEEEKKQEIREENPFDFQNYGNKEMFGTQIQQNLQFEDINNQKFVFGQQDQEIKGSHIYKYGEDTPRSSFKQSQPNNNDFGFNFDFTQNQKINSPQKQNKIKIQQIEQDKIQQMNFNKEDEIMENKIQENKIEAINFQQPKSQNVKQMKSQQNEKFMEQKVISFNNNEAQNIITQEESGEGIVYQYELTNDIDDQIQESNPGFEEYQTQINPRNSIKGVNQSLTNKNKQTSLFQSPVKNLLKNQKKDADQFNFADSAPNDINQFKTSIPQKQNLQSNEFQFDTFNFQTQNQQKPQQQSNDFDFNFSDFQAPKNVVEDFKDQQIQIQTFQNQNIKEKEVKNNNLEKEVDIYIQQEQELEEFLRKSKLESKQVQIHQKDFFEDQNINILQENFINNQRPSESQTPLRSSLKKHKKELQIQMKDFSEPSSSVTKDQSPFQILDEVIDFPNSMKNQKDLEQEKKLSDLKQQMKQIHVQQWWKQLNTEQNYNDGIDLNNPYASQKYNDQFQNIIEELKESIQHSEKAKEEQKQFDQNMKVINNEVQQMKEEKSKFVARISELEYEIESFNSQIIIIRQECEKELRNKESECSIMQRNISAMKIEVQNANDLQARFKSIEDNYNKQLNEKDRLYQQLQSEQIMLKQEMGLKQRQIDNFDADKMDLQKQISNLQNQLADEIVNGNNKSQDAIFIQQISKEKQELISQIKELENQIFKIKTDNSLQQQATVPLIGVQQINSVSNQQQAQQNLLKIPQQINFLMEPQISPQIVDSIQQINIQQSPYINIIETSNNSQLNRQNSFLFQNSNSPNLQISTQSDQLQRIKSQNIEPKTISPIKNENPFSHNSQQNQQQQSNFNLNQDSEKKSQLSTKSENRLSVGSISQINIDINQQPQKQSQQQSFGNVVQNMQSQNNQLLLLKQKLFNFHINSLLQGQKCVIYEDVHVKIGLIRNIIMPKINPMDPNSNDIKTLFKIFLRNQNQQQLLLNYVNLQFVYQKNVQQSANIAKILKSSHVLPLEFPNQNALKPNETIEIDMEITLSLNQQNAHNMNIINSLRNLTFGSIQLNLQYELSNSKKSGTLPIQVPFNIMHFLEPLGSLLNYEFKGLWNKIVQQEQNKPTDLFIQKIFILDKQKVQNMQKLLQVVTMNNVCFAQIKEVDTAPNILNFAAQLKILNQNNQSTSERTWILMKMELTKEGSNCKLAVVTTNDNYSICQNVVDTILGLISAQ